MWPIGHVAVAYLCYALSTHSRLDNPPDHGPTVLLGVAALLPDLIDKPLAWYLGVLPGGRTLGHSLLLLVPLSFAAYGFACWHNANEYGIAFAVGALSHTLLDIVPVLWDPGTPWEALFWPVLSSGLSPEGAPTVLGLLSHSLSNPYFLVEFLLLGIALLVWRADGYPGLSLLLDRPKPV